MAVRANLNLVGPDGHTVYAGQDLPPGWEEWPAALLRQWHDDGVVDGYDPAWAEPEAAPARAVAPVAEDEEDG